MKSDIVGQIPAAGICLVSFPGNTWCRRFTIFYLTLPSVSPSVLSPFGPRSSAVTAFMPPESFRKPRTMRIALTELPPPEMQHQNPLLFPLRRSAPVIPLVVIAISADYVWRGGRSLVS